MEFPGLSNDHPAPTAAVTRSDEDIKVGTNVLLSIEIAQQELGCLRHRGHLLSVIFTKVFQLLAFATVKDRLRISKQNKEKKKSSSIIKALDHVQL